MSRALERVCLMGKGTQKKRATLEKWVEPFGLNSDQKDFLERVHATGIDIYTENGGLTEFGLALQGRVNQLVVSIAGSGKTTFLLHKIIYDIVGGYAKNSNNMLKRIFVGTFLRTGADELRLRFSQLCHKLGYVDMSKQITFGTLHSEFLRVLRVMGVEPKLLNGKESFALFSTAVDKCGIKNKGRSLTPEDYRIIDSVISYYLERLDAVRFEHPNAKDYGLYSESLKLVVETYDELKRAKGVMDFNDLQRLLYKYTYETPNTAVQDMLKSRYDILYLDEFQDTSQIQYYLLKFYLDRMKGEENKVIAIGDPDQCFIPTQSIKVEGGIKSIGEIEDKSLVASYGGCSVETQEVEGIHEKEYTGDLIEVEIKANGRRRKMVGTPEHIAFARRGEREKGFYQLYLYYRAGDGYFMAILNETEKAKQTFLDNTMDLVWYLMGADEKDVLVYLLSKLTEEGVMNKVIDIRRVVDLFKCDLRYPIHVFDPKKQTRGDLSPYFPPILFYTMFSKSRKGATLEGYVKEDNYVDLFNKVEGVDIEVTDTDDWYTINGGFGGLDEQLDKMVELQSKCPKEVFFPVKRAEIGGLTYYFTPFTNLKRGMKVPLSGERGITEGVIQSVKHLAVKNQRVVDLNLTKTRNYIADGCIVHNCIYSWRGSDVDIINSWFEKDFKASVSLLTRNYRCPENILTPVVNSITKNERVHEVKIQAAKSGGEHKILAYNSLHKMGEQLALDIYKDVIAGKSVGVLCRTNYDGCVPAFSLELDGRVAYNLSNPAMVSGANLYERYILLTYLFTGGTREQVTSALELVVPYAKRNYVRRIAMKLSRQPGLLFSQLDKEVVRKESQGVLTEFHTMLQTVCGAGLLDNKKQFDGLFVGYHFILNVILRNNKGAFALNAAGVVRGLVEVASHLSDGSTLSDFTTEVQRIMGRMRARTQINPKSVTIATVHEFKGKERDVIYLWNDTEGVFPSKRVDTRLESVFLEEERRLHYVACTRAKEKMVMLYTEGRPGLFLREIQEGLS